MRTRTGINKNTRGRLKAADCWSVGGSKPEYDINSSRTPAFFAGKLKELLPINVLQELVSAWETEQKTASFADFMEVESKGLWKKEPHLDFLCDKLEQVADGKIKRLIVTMPPRHGKSLACSKKFPAWYLRKLPDNRIIITSYTADLAFSFSRIARDTIINSPELFPGIKVNPNSRSVKSWDLLGGLGGLIGAGVGGGITGFGGNCLIIDDPYKNFEEANSYTVREKVWEWYRSTLRTRLAPGGSIVLILTRWHQDDLAGKLLREAKENDGEHWDVVDFPAIAEDSDVLGREKGEALSPRFPLYELEKLKKSLGNYIFSALYQQNPRAKDGNFFLSDWFRATPDIENLREKWKTNMQQPEIYAAMDFAVGEKEQNDYNSIIVGMKKPEEGDRFILLDRISFKGDAAIIAHNILSVQEKYKPLVFGFEDGVIRKAIWSTVTYIMGKMGAKYAVNEKFFTPIRDKVTRARPLQGQIRQGFWQFPKKESWYQEFEDQMLGFPYGKHDDDVDAFAYLAMLMLEDNELFSNLDLS